MSDFLPPLADGTPAGPDLEMKPKFAEMELAAKGKPESQYGNTIEAAVPPDWKTTAALADELLEQTRDLRIMAFQTIAKLHLDGIPGFIAGLSAIRLVLESAWEHVHPLLDPEDDNDPIQRSNALLRLANPINVQRALRETPLAVAGRRRPVTYRDIAVLNGSMEAEAGHERMNEAEIRDVVANSDQARYAAVRDGIATAVADIDAIGAVFDSQASAGSGPDLTPVSKMLREMHKELVRLTPAIEEDPLPSDETVESSGAGDGLGGQTAPRGRGFASIRAITSLSSRDDAVHAIGLATAYFLSHEPSSPLPLLLERAKRLAPMPFMDILRDLAPDGLAQAQTVAGVKPE